MSFLSFKLFEYVHSGALGVVESMAFYTVADKKQQKHYEDLLERGRVYMALLYIEELVPEAEGLADAMITDPKERIIDSNIEDPSSKEIDEGKTTEEIKKNLLLVKDFMKTASKSLKDKAFKLSKEHKTKELEILIKSNTK